MRPLALLLLLAGSSSFADDEAAFAAFMRAWDETQTGAVVAGADWNGDGLVNWHDCAAATAFFLQGSTPTLRVSTLTSTEFFAPDTVLVCAAAGHLCLCMRVDGEYVGRHWPRETFLGLHAAGQWQQWLPCDTWEQGGVLLTGTRRLQLGPLRRKYGYFGQQITGRLPAWTLLIAKAEGCE